MTYYCNINTALFRCCFINSYCVNIIILVDELTFNRNEAGTVSYPRKLHVDDWDHFLLSIKDSMIFRYETGEIVEFIFFMVNRYLVNFVVDKSKFALVYVSGATVVDT